MSIQEAFKDLEIGHPPLMVIQKIKIAKGIVKGEKIQVEIYKLTDKKFIDHTVSFFILRGNEIIGSSFKHFRADIEKAEEYFQTVVRRWKLKEKKQKWKDIRK